MCNCYGCSVPRVLLYFTSVTFIPHTFPPTPLPLPSPPPYYVPHVPTTASPLAPPLPFPTPHTCLTVVAYKCNVQPCYGAAGCSPQLTRTPHPPLSLPPRCTSTSRPVSSVGSFLSAVSPPGPEPPPGTFDLSHQRTYKSFNVA